VSLPDRVDKLSHFVPGDLFKSRKNPEGFEAGHEVAEQDAAGER
jgi:hypothetical protein